MEKLMPYRWIAYVLVWYIFQMYRKHPKLAVFCGYRIVATFAQKRCLH